MQPGDLAAQCAKAINWHTQNGWPMEHATITIVLPRRWKAPPKFPKRELLCENSKSESVYSLSAVDVLAWLVSNGLVQMAPAQ